MGVRRSDGSRALTARGLEADGAKGVLKERLLQAIAPRDGGDAGGAGDAGPAARQTKYRWVDADQHTFTPRLKYGGSEVPVLGSEFGHLDVDSAYAEWFKMFDAPEDEYMERAANSEGYRHYRALHKLDGKNADGAGKRCYDGAGKITYADMRHLDAKILLDGLDPAVSRAKVYAGGRPAVVGHRSAELFTQDRETMVRKFHHPSDPAKKTTKGQPGHDNLHQVAPVAKSVLKMCRKETLEDPGKDGSLDEETLMFQGASADMKQKCARYKGSDGLQADAVCWRGGMLGAFQFRGHSLAPTVSVKDHPEIKLNETVQKLLWVMYLAGVKGGMCLGMDNLYNSVDTSHMLEEGATFVFDVPAGWTADVDFTGNESARRIEWAVSDVHIVGTLRGNRGSESAYKWPEKMSKAEMDALKEKPLVPDRIKARVTADKAQVITVAILDKKGFQMIDTVHTGIVEETKPRVIFDRAVGRPGVKDVPITNTQNLYNHIMGFVDLDDLLTWFYRCAASA